MGSPVSPVLGALRGALFLRQRGRLGRQEYAVLADLVLLGAWRENGTTARADDMAGGYSRRIGRRAVARLAELGIVTVRRFPWKPSNYRVDLARVLFLAGEERERLAPLDVRHG